MLAENIIYRDLDLSMTRHEGTDDVLPLLNVKSVMRSIRHLFMLNKYDIPFDASQFAGLQRLLFEPASNITAGNLHTMAEWLIRTSEPRVEIVSLEVNTSPDETGYTITLFFKIKSLNQEDRMDILLQRVR